MEDKADQREERVMKMYVEMEERHREEQRKHELEVTKMMMSFMERLSNQPPYPTQPFNQSYYN